MPSHVKQVVVEDLLEDAKTALIFIDQTLINHPDKKLSPLLQESLSILVDAITVSIGTVHLLSHVNKHSLAEAQVDYMQCIQNAPKH